MSLEGVRKDGVQLALLNKRGSVGTEIVGLETVPLLYFFFLFLITHSDFLPFYILPTSLKLPWFHMCVNVGVKQWHSDDQEQPCA